MQQIVLVRLDVGPEYLIPPKSYYRHNRGPVQLLTYCVAIVRSELKNTQCYDMQYTFEQLKEKNVTSTDLFEWYAPIDINDQYERYLNSNNDDYSQSIYCNCSGQSFGKRCEYTFHRKLEITLEESHTKIDPFNIIIDEQFEMKAITHTDWAWNTDNTVCYVGISHCGSICLDWRNICYGKIDCSDAQDEYNCLQLEQNQCNNETEYRCRNGICIPKIFSFDNYPHCLDASDELENNNELSAWENCMMMPSVECEEHFCGVSYFSCGDGQCMKLLAKDNDNVCTNKADYHYLRYLLLANNMLKTNKCWNYILCKLNLNLYINDLKCLNTEYTLPVCSEELFLFSNNSIAYPSVKFIYNKTSRFEDIIPDYVCYDKILCQQYFKPTIILYNLHCNKYGEIGLKQNYSHNEWFNILFDIQKFFSICSADMYRECSNRDLIHCGDQYNVTCISKERLFDGEIDCINKLDETITNTSEICNMNLINRYHCMSNNDRCIPRRKLNLIDNEDCLIGLEKSLLEIDYTLKICLDDSPVQPNNIPWYKFDPSSVKSDQSEAHNEKRDSFARTRLTY
ncbi:unnamed protein product [Didymodactylos carnosus]|uniref:EGF-like domain-containing protein n=1 Tax=Didymodactylos carnosus TaxID=1234261 RepID=A0A8S2NEE9_9BILA|nr:unnamed protein product [Didymodactylos carnosus]CAF3990947.1 unnamed protein product [Didymodactylos carnosus]